MVPASPRRSLGKIVFSCESVFCRKEAKHFSLPIWGTASDPTVDTESNHSFKEKKKKKKKKVGVLWKGRARERGSYNVYVSPWC